MKKFSKIFAVTFLISMLCCRLVMSADETTAPEFPFSDTEVSATASETTAVPEIFGQTVIINSLVPVTQAPMLSNSELPLPYDANTAYQKGDRVLYEGKIFEAQWYTKGETPNINNQWGAWKYIADAETEETDPEPETTTPESPYISGIVTTEPPAEIGGGRIVLDGYYDDWMDKPKTELTYDGNDDQRQNYISIYEQDGILYFYAQVRANGMFDGNQFKLTGKNGNKTLNIGARSSLGSTPPIGSISDLELRDYSWNLLGSGKLTMSESSNEMEFAISLDTLRNMGWTDDDLSELRFSNSSYGRGEAVITGASTGANLLIAAGFIICMAGILIWQKKSKKEVA